MHIIGVTVAISNCVLLAMSDRTPDMPYFDEFIKIFAIFPGAMCSFWGPGFQGFLVRS